MTTYVYLYRHVEQLRESATDCILFLFPGVHVHAQHSCIKIDASSVTDLEDECLSQHLRIQQLELQVRDDVGWQDLIYQGFEGF